MKRLLTALFAFAAVVTDLAADSLLSGSIDFNEPGLWGKTVSRSLDDDGGASGPKHWFLSGESASAIWQHFDASGRREGRGYLTVDTFDGTLYRSMPEVTDDAGPAEGVGQTLAAPIYFDSEVRFSTVASEKGPELEPTDKIVFWFHSADPDSLADCSFRITAAVRRFDGSYAVTNYAPGISFSAARVDSPIRLTVRASVEGGVTGFRVWLDGNPVICADGRDFYPSLVTGETRSAQTLSAVGFTGSGEAEYLNFTREDPLENPAYASTDLSMLRQAAEFSVDDTVDADGLLNFPVLVKIHPDWMPGFSYDYTKPDGSDLRFLDENGRLVPHEIDTWRGVWLGKSDVSLVWVRMPYFRPGARLTMHWDLAPGNGLPANDPRQVWRDYVAVWHLGDARGNVRLADSTGNGYDAKVSGGSLSAFASPLVGASPYIERTGGLESLFAPSHAAALENGAFTFTGWYWAKDLVETSAPFVGTKWGEGVTDADAAGWCGVYRVDGNGNQMSFHYSGTTGKRYSKQNSLLAGEWTFLAVAHTAEDKADLYVNDASFRTGVDYEIAPTDRPFQLLLNGFAGDEIRVAKVVRSAAWVRAEYAQVKHNCLVTPGAIAKSGYNFWLEEPSVEPSSWARGEEAGEVRLGAARHGEVFVRYYDVDGREVSRPVSDSPAGTYTAVFTATDGGLHRDLVKAVNVVVFEPRGTRTLAEVGRVMLFNSDATPGAEVSLQGFEDVDDDWEPVWGHSGEVWQGDVRCRFVKPGTSHVYYAPGTGGPGRGRALWTVSHGRIGNLFTSDDGLEPDMNFLPWGGFARRFDDSEMACDRQRYAGSLILQNVRGAAIESAAFTNGVGTVYFDTVNAHCGFVNGVALQLRGATAAGWTTVPVDVFAITNGVCASVASNETGVVLAMDKLEGSVDWFYRVRATINTNASVRVRIVRTDDDWNAAGEPDGQGLVLVDNIVVSPPATAFRLESFGAPADESDPVFRGWKAPFEVAFPTTNDLGRMRGAVKVDYLGGAPDPLAVGSLSMFYRWRYLNQSLDETWTEVLMKPDPADPTRFLTVAPLQGSGVGDIEYRFHAVVNAPFYQYVDYSGLTGWSWPDAYTGRRADESLRREEKTLTRAGGTDFFVRIREGASEYEGAFVRIKTSADGPETRLPMTLWSGHTWRGLYQTTNALPDGLWYRFELVNRQVSGATDYNLSTNWLTSADQPTLPVNDVVFEQADAWARLPCDAATGYLMFQLDDAERGLTVVHADYQSFNGWTDAMREDGDVNGHFVGTSTTNATKAGVSAQTRTLEDTFDTLHEISPTNSLWENSFNVSGTGAYEVDVPRYGEILPFPNGWSGANGMWVPQFYGQAASDSVSLQLSGVRAGSLSFRIANPPHGVESLSYRVRVAQGYEFLKVNYYTGNSSTNGLMDFMNSKFATNYAFAVRCSMRSTAAGEAEFTGRGSVSAFAYYRPSVGAYEARLVRTATNDVRLCIYKWSKEAPSLLASMDCPGCYRQAALDGPDSRTLAGLFVSCSNGVASTVVRAGFLRTGQVVTSSLSGPDYFQLEAVDADAPLTSGSFGLSSCECPAVFASPVYCSSPAVFKQSRVVFDEELGLFEREADAAAWEIFDERLPAKDKSVLPKGRCGFKAQPPAQDLIVRTAPHLGGYDLTITNRVRSFEFTTVTNFLYLCDDRDFVFQLENPTNLTDVVIDDIVIRQWAGSSYDDEDNEDNKRGRFYNVSYGAPTNIVYTTAWVGPEGGVELAAMRTTPVKPASVRSPLMDGDPTRGSGLGMLSFSYRDADRHVKLLVQVATNAIDITRLKAASASMDDAYWTTVGEFAFDRKTDGELASGSCSFYLGLHGVAGAARVVLAPEVVRAARDAGANPTGDPTYGRIVLTSFLVRDNPTLDPTSWWGWNLRTTSDESMIWLEDYAGATARGGLAFALNNSIVDDVRFEDAGLYRYHKPFLQTPVFTNAEGKCLGEIAFRARKYATADPPATVAVYGTRVANSAAADDAEFVYLGEVVVESDRYQSYTFRTDVTDSFSGFRLAVTGVDGVEGDGTGDGKGPTPGLGYVRRVLIDEVAVFEAIRARMAFRRVGAFRNHLGDAAVVPNVPGQSEQPICGESWGVQAELFAVQLSEKIDRRAGREPRVYLHWYGGRSPWGYENWKDSPAAHVAELAPATDADSVYRSSYLTAPDAVIPPTNRQSVVQYSLEVVYYMEGSDTPLSSELSLVDWVKPSWYDPVDYNAQHGSFSAYAILDSVPSGWAWINEVNLFGGYNDDGQNVDANGQYIEVIAPEEADLTDWQIRGLAAQTGSGSVVTNVIATFGEGDLSGMKVPTPTSNHASGMVFRVVANSAAAGRRDLGTLDAVWSFDNPDGTIFKSNGSISLLEPFGLQLVRPSGVVEHEIVVLGTNYWDYSVAERAKFFNDHLPHASFFYAGADELAEPASLGVWTGHGESAGGWTNRLVKTPGSINLFADGTPQVLEPTHPTPLGSSLVLRAYLGDRHLQQALGPEPPTSNDLVVVMQKGSEVGTNITYYVDPWYELGDVTTNGASVAVVTNDLSQRRFAVTVGVNCSNDLTLVASTAVCRAIRDLVPEDQSKYLPAIADWFERGENLYRQPWPDSNGEIYLATFQLYKTPSVTNLLNLAEMYWLDLCPTTPDQWLIGGFSRMPQGVVVSTTGSRPETALTNVTMTAYLAVSNGLDRTGSIGVYAPYVLQGLRPGSNSWGDISNWSDATYHVIGIMLNGLTRDVPECWWPLRWFVFDENSFRPAGTPDEFTADIEIDDPYSMESPGYAAGWYSWAKANGKWPIVGYRFDISERQRPFGVEMLRTNNYYRISH